MTNPGSYFEIPVTDLDRAIGFYQAVFDCKLERQEIDGNEMALFPAEEGVPGITGALAKGKTYVPSQTGSLIYLHSPNIETTLLKVQAQGGKTLYPKTSLGPLGFVAEFEDSEGNRVALHQPAAK